MRRLYLLYNFVIRQNYLKMPELLREKIILGIDPGTNIMGYGIIRILGNKLSMIALGVLKLNKYDDHPLRLKIIFEKTLSLIEQYKPDELAIGHDRQRRERNRDPRVGERDPLEGPRPPGVWRYRRAGGRLEVPAERRCQPHRQAAGAQHPHDFRIGVHRIVD